jgi:16S rRNA (guanine527-N7)-methyltransferase
MEDEVETKLRRLAELIARSPHNLVSRGDRADVLRVHIRECQSYAETLELASGQRWIDVGTGGGLPGLVLALVVPDVHWTLLDSVGKKTDAVRAFAAELNVTNVTVLNGRAEELAHEPALRGQFDGAISRAVAALPTLVEVLAGFVRPGGMLVAAKGPRWQEEMEEAREAVRRLGLAEDRVVPIHNAVRPTWLVMMRRRGALAKSYPRRAGLPRSHPLGGAPA